MRKNDRIFPNRLVTIETLKTYLKSVKVITLKAINNRTIGKDVQDILDKYNFSIYELCYRLKNNIPFDKIFKCKVCGKKIDFCHIGFLGYRDYCSKKCSTKDTSQMESVIKKREQTMLKKFGAKNYMATKEFQENREANTFKKYGVTNYTQTKEFKNFLKKHINEMVSKAKQTCLKKYGVDCYTKTKEYKDNFDKVKKKMEQTCLKRYGVDSYNKTQEYKDKFKDKEYVKQIQEKIYLVKKQNNSFNTSKYETIIFDKLKNKFPDTKKQYKEKRYPFNCDFYIPSKDLFIEFNGMWTHHTEFFDKNNPKHIELLNLWKSKNTDFYKRAIRTWTETDIAKKEIAEKNNLNYLVLWNIEDFNRWYQNA